MLSKKKQKICRFTCKVPRSSRNILILLNLNFEYTSLNVTCHKMRSMHKVHVADQNTTFVLRKSTCM